MTLRSHYKLGGYTWSRTRYTCYVSISRSGPPPFSPNGPDSPFFQFWLRGTSMPKHPSDWHETFLARLTKRLSIEPSTALNPQCLSEQTLYGILDDLDSDGFRPRDSKGRITAWLQEIGLLKVIPVDHAQGKTFRPNPILLLRCSQEPVFADQPSRVAPGISLKRCDLLFHGDCVSFTFYAATRSPSYCNPDGNLRQVRSSEGNKASRRHLTKSARYASLQLRPDAFLQNIARGTSSSRRPITLHWAEGGHSHHQFGTDSA